ncbi:glyoxylase-like metal-dependent hydrolase (beta-lactamase superfamily II) [Cytobacillus eiseniae]|uniref:Glyoxylase-like metal-dependent hydrolase (Beta-lactamase superfamily II) n=1 Tax=Cytobacillus eiseniae TaxID=762947 RepID=A0ABS4RK74_9BACI|nr:MBL fold metallo-hydrolase [Cytobacillus eiseniae]MBP2242192.1 glyoxylase-like metal-dependent hydrolase (beta-lactamase superfamily II) [Cytobacillus eiseniae]
MDLGLGVSIIDAMDLGKERRTGSYVLHAEQLTIIETCASPSIRYILKGLKVLGIDPAEIKNIIVTHIHLDHAGGVGLLLEICPHAKVIVHPRGKRHLADPTKLIKGAKAVYGARFDELFEPILPVPEDRLVVKEDGDTLQIGENRVLTFFDTPGHANHHFSIHDSMSNGVFTGDTIGVYYPQLMEKGVELCFPSTSPNQFDPDAMLQSLEKIKALAADRIYFGHYGMTTNPTHMYEQIEYWLALFMEESRRLYAETKEEPMIAKVETLFESLYAKVVNDLAEKGISLNQEMEEIIQLDLRVGSMGIIDYLEKNKGK